MPTLYWVQKEGYILNAKGERIAHVLGTKADASLIVRAVNSHDELLAALVAVRNDYRAYIMESKRNLDDAYGSRTLAQIDQAIAKAEEK